MKGEKVSVITPVFNNKEDIIGAMESVLNQSHKDWEHIIIDDCSTDGTYQIVKEYIDKLKDKRFILKRNSKNMGCYCSINEGLLVATGDYVTLLGSDDTLHLDKLKKQLGIFILYPDTMGVEAYYQRETIISRNNDVTLIYKRSVIKEIGYYDSLRFGADSEFKERFIKKYGKKIIKIPEILYFAKIRPNSLTRSKITGRKDVRVNYRNTFKSWHNRTKEPFIPYPLKTRPFEVPDIMLP